MVAFCVEPFQEFDGLLVNEWLAAREHDVVRLFVRLYLFDDRIDVAPRVSRLP